MTAPLSPTPSAALNSSAPSAGAPPETLDTRSYSLSSSTSSSRQPVGDNTENGAADGPDGDDTSVPPARGPSPPKARPASRIISGSELSPLKILQQQQQQSQQQQQQQQPASDESPAPAKGMPQSPRKAPIKRFPVRVSHPGSAASESPRRLSQERRSSAERLSSLQDALRENEGLKQVIDIFEDEVNALHDDADDDIEMEDRSGDSLSTPHAAASQHEPNAEEEHAAAAGDDTMISTFSTFSALPNLTSLTQMRSDSPTGSSASGEPTLRPPARTADPTPSSMMMTPRAANGHAGDSGNTTNLMDFTEQLRYGSYGPQPTPSRRGSQMPPPSSAMRNAVTATPQRPGSGNNLVNLLDFDIPPMPTPRSVPSITPRELESLKSGFLSEISSLKASLSGKEAEVLSLKTAVGDAEKRVGECMEQLREVQCAHEALAAEKESWEQRGREMEALLRQVREEIVISQREREELEFKLEEAEKRREAAEIMAQEAESKMAGMRAGKASAEAAAAAGGDKAAIPSNKEVEMAVERVARELHSLYKSKHETKVAALKKSYETRWEKKLRELQAQVDQLARENSELRAGGSRDAAHSRADAARLAELEEERRAERAQLRELEAEVEKVEAVLRTVQADNDELRALLERERIEKGELVLLAEELMNMQSFAAASEENDHSSSSSNAARPDPEPAPAPPSHHHHQQPAPQPAATVAKTPSRRQSSSLAARNTPRASSAGENGTTGNLRASTSFRSSGLRAPGASGVSRIGRVAPHERTKSATAGGGGNSGSGVPRPLSGQGLRGGGSGGGGIMSSIERMGSYGGSRYGMRGGE